MVEQCPGEVSESVSQPDPTTVQQHIEIGAVASGRGNGKMLGKRVMLRLHGTSIIMYVQLLNILVYNTVLLFSFSQLYEIK